MRRNKFTSNAKNESYSPSDSVRLAGDILAQLMESAFDWAGPWAGEVVQVRRLIPISPQSKC
jgi:hypothetical protein